MIGYTPFTTRRQATRNGRQPVRANIHLRRLHRSLGLGLKRLRLAALESAPAIRK